MKNVNYTPEVTQAIVTTYTDAPNMDTVRALAENHGKTVKSIIGKLSREGVYQKATYTTKTGAKPITKAEIVAQIVDKLDLDVDAVAGLEKAPKSALVTIRDAIAVVREKAMEVVEFDEVLPEGDFTV
tara:strand:- start:204 stop:587 length:384 start_codon:yes stop_codon:yes gene_type:complete